MITILLIGMAGDLGACAGHGADSEQLESEAAVNEHGIEAVQERLTDSVLALPGVVGTAIGECDGEPCLKVLVVGKSQELAGEIPATFGGFPVVVEETGEISALDPLGP